VGGRRLCVLLLLVPLLLLEPLLTCPRCAGLVVNDVISMEEVQELRDTLESGGEDNAPLYGIDMTTHHPSFLALARDTRITDIIAKLIGENIVLQHSKTVHKTPANPEGPRPGGGPVRFHQDFAYFPHTNYDVLAAMLVLDDFTEENVRRPHTLLPARLLSCPGADGRAGCGRRRACAS